MEEKFEGEQTVEDFENLGETEQTAEAISRETAKKLGETAGKAVDLDRLREEVEEKVIKEEDPNAGYEILAEGREEVTGETGNGE